MHANPPFRVVPSHTCPFSMLLREPRPPTISNLFDQQWGDTQPCFCSDTIKCCDSGESLLQFQIDDDRFWRQRDDVLKTWATVVIKATLNVAVQACERLKTNVLGEWRQTEVQRRNFPWLSALWQMRPLTENAGLVIATSLVSGALVFHNTDAFMHMHSFYCDVPFEFGASCKSARERVGRG